MLKKYKISGRTRLVKDEASVKFHVASDDYFGTLATILSLLEQDIKKNERPNGARLLKTLKNLESDLLFLQKNYQISIKSQPSKKAKPQTNPKTKNRKIIPKGRLINQ